MAMVTSLGETVMDLSVGGAGVAAEGVLEELPPPPQAATATANEATTSRANIRCTLDIR
jgi:hypothetical protein